MTQSSLRRGNVMDKATVDLKNCYGIKALKTEFDFSQKRAYAIYAPNGVMKTSFAKTFQDVASGQKTVDRIFPGRKTTRLLTDENGDEISSDGVCVVLSYDQAFGPSKKTSTLLVDATLRKKHELLSADIDTSKGALLNAIKKQSGAKRDFEAEIAQAFVSDNLQTALTRIRKEIHDHTDTPFAEVQYDVVFDDKVIGALDTKDLKKKIEEYIQRYNELLAKSTYFKKGTFDYYNAKQIAKILADNGFFEAKHTVSLIAPDGRPREIRTRTDLESVISEEKDLILKDAKLRKSFDDVAGQLARNVTLRDFQSYLMDNEALLSCMNNIPKFKQDVFKSYIKANEGLYNELMSKYDAAETGLKEIREAAMNQRTLWQVAIDTFNSRFKVPFILQAKNYVDVMLGVTESISVAFTYKDEDESVSIEHPDLIEVLSSGELKALYILNVIFEVETRRESGQETLFVIDDLADSFDYKNKYAIVQYLKEISEDQLFKQIIMTHNFDFFRTIQGRLVVSYANCLMARKGHDKIILDPAEGIKNIFGNWKDNFFSSDRKKIACIPFLRNLAEFTKGFKDENYLKLTSLLHLKSDTHGITVGDLDAIFNNMCETGGVSQNDTKAVWDLIFYEADACLTADIGVNFENKVVLAIATRLAAERFMIDKINDSTFVSGIKFNQTSALITEFTRKFKTVVGSIAVLDRVALMTPENIHLNSFMYEPIIDMSDEHLKELYTDTKNLT